MLTEVQPLDVAQIRKDFPILSSKMHGNPLVYLDNAASAQKPQTVIDRLSKFYSNEYATVSRGVYDLSQSATAECNQVREQCRELLNAQSSEEIVFVRGATEAINLVAACAMGHIMVHSSIVIKLRRLGKNRKRAQVDKSIFPNKVD